MAAQTVSSCVVCGATTDRFLCGSERHGSGCLGELLRQLGDCAALVDELNTTLSRQDKLGSASVGFVTSSAQRPIPLNLGAMDAGTRLRDVLGSWARMLWEDNKAAEPHCGACGVEQSRHAEGPARQRVDWYHATPTLDIENRIVPISRWLMRHPQWIALCAATDDLVEEIREATRGVRRAIDTAPGKVYLGECSADLEDGSECQVDLYAREGEYTKRCPVCLTDHDVDQRRRDLKAAVEHQYVPVGLLVGLVNAKGRKATTSSIRNLRFRGRITGYIRDPECEPDKCGFRVRVWKDEDGGERLYLVREVLDALATTWQRKAA